MFFVRHQGQVLLFDCPFDEDTEDYPDDYRVYVMPEIGELDLSASWMQLPLKALRTLGVVAVADVAFDSTRRSAIDPAILDRFAPNSTDRLLCAGAPRDASSEG
jgi:hypothetical protein